MKNLVKLKPFCKKIGSGITPRGVTVENNDVLLNITGDPVARCCKVPDSILPARVNQHVSIIRADKSKINPNFLMYFLVSPLMQSKMLSLAGSGGTRKALTKEMIESFDIPSIDIEMQDRISNVLFKLLRPYQQQPQKNPAS